MIFREELAELKDLHLQRFTLVYVMTREQQDIELFNGRITPGGPASCSTTGSTSPTSTPPSSAGPRP